MKKKVLSIILVLMLLLSACTTGVGDTGLQTGGTLPSETSGDVQLSQSKEATLPTTSEQPTENIPTEPELPTGSAAILDAAYRLAPGESLEGVYTLTGTITAIDDAYSYYYENISVVMAVDGCEDRPVLCFRLEGTGVEHITVGDTITVTGELTNYKGTIEFNAGCTLDSYVSTNPIQPGQPRPDNDDSKEAVALYIHTYGRLPDFYMTKSQAKRTYGWEGGALDTYAPGYAIGGDTFYNYDGQLPDAPGRRWTECDIDTIGRTARGAKRIVFSNDGLVYYTDDHYETFTLMYGEP